MSSSHRRIIKVRRPISQVVVVPSGNQEGAVSVLENAPEQYAERDHGSSKSRHQEVSGVRLSEEALDQIREEAYQQGVNEGLEQGAQEALNQLHGTFKSLQNIIDTIHQQQQLIYRHSEGACLELLLAMTEKIVGTLDVPAKNIIHETLHKVLKSAEIAGRVKILVHPDNLNHITEVENELRRHFPDLKELGIIEDSAISPGGCVIETDLGKVDARINTQMNEMTDTLRKLYQEMENDEHQSSPNAIE